MTIDYHNRKNILDYESVTYKPSQMSENNRSNQVIALDREARRTWLSQNPEETFDDEAFEEDEKIIEYKNVLKRLFDYRKTAKFGSDDPEELVKEKNRLEKDADPNSYFKAYILAVKNKNSKRVKNDYVNLNQRDEKNEALKMTIGEVISKLDRVGEETVEQDWLSDEVEDGIKEMKGEGERVIYEMEAVKSTIETLIGDGKTYGLKYEANWLQENTPKIADKIKKIRSRELKTQDDIDQANYEIQKIMYDYQAHMDTYERYSEDQTEIQAIGRTLQKEMEDIIEDQVDLEVMAHYLDMDYSLSTRMGHSFTNALIDLAQGLATAAEFITVGIGTMGKNMIDDGVDTLIDSGAITNPNIIATVRSVQAADKTAMSGVNLISGSRWDDDSSTVSLTERMHQNVDKWQAEWDG